MNNQPRTTQTNARGSGRPAIRHARAVIATATLLVVAGQAHGQEIRLNTIARDFESAHPDFGIGAAARAVANISDVSLDLDNTPVFSSQAFQIEQNWYDMNLNPIPWDFAEFLMSDATISLVTPPTIVNQGVVDTWDPDNGPYDPLNGGPPPQVLVNEPMPTISVPAGPANYMEEYLVQRQGTVTTGELNASLRCKRFFVLNNFTLTINGNLLVVVEDEFEIGSKCEIEISPGSSLTIYTLGSVLIRDQAMINANTQNPALMTVINAGTNDVLIPNQVEIYANIISPQGDLVVTDGTDFFGSFTGQGMRLENQGGIHITGGIPGACYIADDEVGARGADTANDITSALTFSQWFRYIPGVNAAKMIKLELEWNNAGYYEHTTSDIRPIDGELLGVGEPANHNFTLETAAGFVFEECGGQYIEWEGDGEMWIFVDGRRAVELGGSGVRKLQRVDMDRLGLVDGQFHIVRFYFAQRRNAASAFSLRTNIGLISLDPGKASGAEFD